MITDRPARVRVYATVAHRDADLPRSMGTPVTGDHGLMLELITATGALDFHLAPPPEVHTDTPDIPFSVTNLGTAGAVIMDITYIQTEA